MPINKILNIQLFLFFLNLLIICNCNAQSLNGLFTLGANNETYFVNFQNKSFELFSLSENPLPGSDVRYIVKDVGKGTYKISNKEFEFDFNSNMLSNQFYSSDSLLISMSTMKTNVGKYIQISLNIEALDYENSYLILEGVNKEYSYQILQGKLSTFIPDSISFNKMYLSLLGYGKRQLPFINQFNILKYEYFIKDNFQHINKINNVNWKFVIESTVNGSFYRFNDTQFLKSVDKNTLIFLREMASQNFQIKEIIKNWF